MRSSLFLFALEDVRCKSALLVFAELATTRELLCPVGVRAILGGGHPLESVGFLIRKALLSVLVGREVQSFGLDVDFRNVVGRKPKRGSFFYASNVLDGQVVRPDHALRLPKGVILHEDPSI